MIRRTRRPSWACPGQPAVTKTGEFSNVTSGENCSATHRRGAICLSEDAYRQVSGRLDMAVADLGPTQLKNIEKSIRVYSLQVGVPAQTKPATPKKRSGLALLAAAGVKMIPA